MKVSKLSMCIHMLKQRWIFWGHNIGRFLVHTKQQIMSSWFELRKGTLHNKKGEKMNKVKDAIWTTQENVQIEEAKIMKSGSIDLSRKGGEGSNKFKHKFFGFKLPMLLH